ncbi:uncharacterized protein LY89DRAFT_645645 [Mollisia scopiformis]|uniref:Inner centromere protein ARK-binding domain-containing protein n=1 Tax=Mollisia scopiformis TaxID=149040 RepID=A0A194X9A5_MOLSC|nr:uncharacterized protein LY89DRAFT_645645 [Mollisia scopiformis]KUJ16750.1 hypothetical protein LY89DRAFT_645645 [Mollisia scopiformis]
MATARANPRLQVGSASWIAEERATALQFAGEETEEFTFSARNDLDWLNEHMAEIFSKNQVNVADIFKTPGKLRGKTPRTARKGNPLEARAPLTDIFSAINQGTASPFKQSHFPKPVATFTVAEDERDQIEVEAGPSSPEVQHKSPLKLPQNFVDSGYHGSQPEIATQATQATQLNDPAVYQQTPSASPERAFTLASPDGDENVVILGRDSDARRTTEESFQSAKEEQTRNVATVRQEKAEEMEVDGENIAPEPVSYPVLESPVQERHEHPESPAKRSSPRRPSPAKQSPVRTSPVKSSPKKASPSKSSPAKQVDALVEDPASEAEDEHIQDVQSPSDGSPSPIRPIVRKSSLNFASLPAREPITTKKSIGNRVSRTSQLEQPRTSYYGRQTGGKSLGNVRQDEHDHDEMDLDRADDEEGTEDDTDSKMKRLHNKTSTQRLQDQISMLGQSQSNMRSSKSIPNTTVQPPAAQFSQAPAMPETQRGKSPVRNSKPPPGAFPDDEEDSWIGPPPAAVAEPSIFSPRPQLPKSHTTDVMEEIHGKDSIGGSQFNIPKRRDQTRHMSPVREPVIPERTTSTLGHVKSVSTSVLRSPKKSGDSPGQMKPISVSNPTPSIASNDPDASTTPPKSPSRSYKGSPLKAAKDKFSSILKTSRGLFASSAAVSAEAKSSALSPVSRTGLKNAPSFEDVMSEANNKSPTSSHAPTNKSQMSLRLPDSPFKHSARKTRASTEREEKKKEESARLAKEAKEAKEAQKQADQLEKARMKVREEARVYHIEQERVAAMQKEVAARKEQEKQAKASQVDIPRATRTSPRKTKAQLEAEGIAAAASSTHELAHTEVEMSEASIAMPPPAIPRPKSQIGRPGPKRPLKPAKEAATKVKPPTVIRVDTGSQRGHHNHPSNVALSASLQDSLASHQSAPTQGLRHKASTSSIQSKASTSSFKSAASKALEAAARKKEQDELAAQRKREAKLEIERQRAANKEEERRKEELQRKQELERQREVQKERERAVSAADAKKAASRQAAEKRRLEMEKAKETRAPPPAVRPQPSVDLGSSMLQEKALPPVPPQRGDFGQSKASRVNPATQRPQEDMSRSVNSTLHSTAKVPPKRPLPQDNEDHHVRPALQRIGPSYQQEHQSKRRRTSEDFDDDEDMTEDHPKMTAPPIRQSSIRQKDIPTKSLFPSGYANAPPPGNLQRSTLIAQHNLNQSKPAHPMDMAQVSKAPIPFASSSSQANHKTPARPGAQNGTGKSAAKSAAKSSPRYQNGENIVLPDILTDSEDEDGEKDDFVPADWTNSPDLRRRLVEQERMDPSAVFGQPGPLNMEEVFSKSKDRFHKFRARTSSANWSGTDRLTEDEIRKDLQARDQVRRQGGWTYDSMV